MPSKKAIIKAGYSCNNNCIFCHARTKKSHSDLTLEEVTKKIDLLKKQDIDCILFSGGEITIRKDLPKILEHAKARGLKTGLITNARMLSNERYFKALSAAGVSQVYTTIHSHDKKLHDEVARADSFDQAIQGIKNCVARKIQIVVNVVITNKNLDSLEEITALLKKIGVDGIRLSFVEAIQKEDFAHTPDIALAAKKVKNILKSDEKGMIGWDGFPLCLMKGFEERKGDLVTNNIALISEVWEEDFFPVDEGNKIKVAECEGCKKNKECEGVYRIYYEERKPLLHPY